MRGFNRGDRSPAFTEDTGPDSDGDDGAYTDTLSYHWWVADPDCKFAKSPYQISQNSYFDQLIVAAKPKVCQTRARQLLAEGYGLVTGMLVPSLVPSGSWLSADW